MAEQPNAPAELAAPKKNKKKVIFVAGAALLLAVALSVTGTWFFLTKNQSDTAQAAQEQESTSQDKQKAIYEELAPAFVVNFHSEGRQRYMQISLALMARNEDELKQLKIHMPALRNQLVMVFSSQDFTDLNSSMGIEILKQRVTAAVQELAIVETGKPVVEQVLFTNFVMQ